MIKPSQLNKARIAIFSGENLKRCGRDFTPLVPETFAMVMVDGRRSGWPQPMQLSVKPWRGLRTQSKPLTCISMPVLRFSSDAEVVKFAKAFLREHLERFRKDIRTRTHKSSAMSASLRYR